MDDWVQQKYRKAYCAKDGRLIAQVIDLDAFKDKLLLQRPNEVEAITSVVKALGYQINSDLCRDLPLTTEGRFLDPDVAQKRLQACRPDLKQKKWRKSAVKRIEEDNITALKAQKQGNPGPAPASNAEEQLYPWIKTQFHDKSSFISTGFIGWRKFENLLINQKPQKRDQIISALGHMKRPGHKDSLESPDKVQQRRRAMERAQQQPEQQTGTQSTKPEPQTVKPNEQDTIKKVPELQFGHLDTLIPNFTFSAGGYIPPFMRALASSPASSPTPTPAAKKTGTAIFGKTAKPGSTAKSSATTHIAKQLQGLQFENKTLSVTDSSSEFEKSSESSDEPSVAQAISGTATPDFVLYSQLLTGNKKSKASGGRSKGSQRDIEQAPLLSGDIVVQHANDLVPQFGLLGCLANEDASLPSAQLFFNTNVPVSTFICGVQGSGKSHTTSCILENAVIPSPYLGKLEKPVSTLVFSYGEWSSGGAGFNISEATYLAAPSKAVPGHRVKRITVLTSPSNLAINSLYKKHPNVRIIPFTLKAKALDISALRTLMAIDEKSSVPLYMAKVESILRGIASKSKDGSLDYIKFKQALKLETFDATQTNMLDMRLNLLESFLDLTDKAPQPDFLPGEITIMDLSDAFVSPNTACILFKLGLERFLQCSAPGKLVVLDEAHKYMLNTPGSKVLTEYLARVIRLQRHLGARVVISTQEPTVSTDLIALCSVTVIHRFTSPAWYNALKKHINAMDDDEKIMHDIEGLETGEAFVYAPNAVLDKNEDGTLVKATGRLLRLNIRDRVTLDGGESIMAV